MGRVLLLTYALKGYLAEQRVLFPALRPEIHSPRHFDNSGYSCRPKLGDSALAWGNPSRYSRNAIDKAGLYSSSSIETTTTILRGPSYPIRTSHEPVDAHVFGHGSHRWTRIIHGSLCAWQRSLLRTKPAIVSCQAAMVCSLISGSLSCGPSVWVGIFQAESMPSLTGTRFRWDGLRF